MLEESNHRLFPRILIKLPYPHLLAKTNLQSGSVSIFSDAAELVLVEVFLNEFDSHFQPT